MLFTEDNTYRDIREKSFRQWLDELAEHEDLNVRGGVTLARGYISTLKAEIRKLKEENELKNQYLKKMAGRK